MNNHFSIRSATEKDIDSIVAMRLSLQEHMSAINANLWKMSEKSIAGLPKFYKSALEDEHCHLVIAEDKASRNILGMGLGRIYEHDEHVPSKSGKIDDIWVEPDYRKKGICKKIFSELMIFFKAKGIEMMVLNFVNGNLEAEAVWKHFGFQPILSTATAKLADVVAYYKK